AHLGVDLAGKERQTRGHRQRDERREERVLDQVLTRIFLHELLEQVLHDFSHSKKGRLNVLRDPPPLSSHVASTPKLPASHRPEDLGLPACENASLGRAAPLEKWPTGGTDVVPRC